MIDPPDPTRERDHSLRAQSHRVTATQPRPRRGRIEGRTGTDMVQRRKLTRDLVANFPDPGARAGIEDKWVVGKSVRFRAFFLV